MVFSYQVLKNAVFVSVFDLIAKKHDVYSVCTHALQKRRYLRSVNTSLIEAEIPKTL